MASYTYRDKGLQTLRRFVKFAKEMYGVQTPSHLLDFKIDGTRNPTTAPNPELIRALLLHFLQYKPDMLMFILLQVVLALRPEEAYRALENAREQFIGEDKFLFTRCKAGTVDWRQIRQMPLIREWLRLVPGWADGSRTDFYPMHGGRRLGYGRMQSLINKFLRKGGYVVADRVAGESLRKASCTAMIVCGAPLNLIMKSTGHKSLDTLMKHYYDPRWTPEMGLAFWSMFPTEEPHNYTPFDLSHVYAQNV